MKLYFYVKALCLFLVFLSLSCTSTCNKTTNPPPAGLAGTPKSQAAAKDTPETERTIISGKVKEVILKEGFSYLNIRTKEGNDEWIAILDSDIKDGSNIKVEEQAILTDFHSKSLNRTFSKIIFGKVVKASK